jgi:transcriptional regulator with XRE-family HTH domain
MTETERRDSGDTIGQRMGRLRRAAGLSQATLARAAGVPAASLRNWEQDRRIPALDAAARVARALGVSLDDLAGRLGGEAGEEAPAPRKRRRKGD